MNQMHLETVRTIMRNLTTKDAHSFFDLNMDDDVLKFTGDEPFNTVEDAFIFLQNYNQHEKYGVGRFAVIDKVTNQFISWCGLRYSG